MYVLILKKKHLYFFDSNFLKDVFIAHLFELVSNNWLFQVNPKHQNVFCSFGRLFSHTNFQIFIFFTNIFMVFDWHLLKLLLLIFFHCFWSMRLIVWLALFSFFFIFFFYLIIPIFVTLGILFLISSFL